MALNRIMRKRTPTLRQIKTLQLIKQGYSTHRAMKEAGYSAATVTQSAKFKKSRAVQLYADSVYPELVAQGFTAKFEAEKIMGWLNATKPFSSHTEPDREIPDNDIQIKAFDRAQQFKPTQPNKGVKRKLTIEEFVIGEEGGDQNPS